MTLFVFGLGYSARAAVGALRETEPGLPMAGTTRSPDAFQAFERLGVRPHVFSGEAPCETLGPDLEAATHLLASIAPGPEGDPALEHHRGDILAAPLLRHITYFSTVGVYGDAGGAWIDESSPAEGTSQRARRRVSAEARWRHLADQKGIPLLVLRLAGIYGPGRSQLDKLREGRAQRINKPGQVFNRIHVDDIARIVALGAGRALEGTFNVADDEPAPPQDVMGYAADLLDMPPPPEVAFAQAELSPMARAFYADNRRISNAAIRRALGIELHYPTYREGLAAIREAERAPDGRRDGEHD